LNKKRIFFQNNQIKTYQVGFATLSGGPSANV